MNSLLQMMNSGQIPTVLVGAGESMTEKITAHHDLGVRIYIVYIVWSYDPNEQLTY